MEKHQAEGTGQWILLPWGARGDSKHLQCIGHKDAKDTMWLLGQSSTCWCPKQLDAPVSPGKICGTPLFLEFFLLEKVKRYIKKSKRIYMRKKNRSSILSPCS